MKLSMVTTAATFFALSLSAYAQTPTPNPSTATATAPAQSVTITGCVQREADYRKTNDSGRGGVAGTGVGTGNEFVLINATAANSSTSPSPTGTAGSSAASPSTAASATMAYELSGSQEGQLAAHVNHRVEITGMLKAQAVNSSGPTGGPTAQVPVVSQDLKLRELEVSSFKMLDSSCTTR